MSRRKKWTLSASAVIFIVLAACTLFSYQNNNRLMPRVKTFTFWFDETCETEYKWYLPEECIGRNSAGRMIVYRMKDRRGRFGKEYYIEEVTIEDYRENGQKQYRTEDGYLRVEAPGIWEGDKIVLESDKDFIPKETVKWANPESDES